MKNIPIRFIIAHFVAVTILMLCLGVKAQNASTLVQWDFPNNPDNAIVDASALAANNAATITTVGGTNALDFTFTGNATNSVYATGWDNGNGAKYWQINISTAGYFSLDLSSKQRSANSGPQDFKVQYKIGVGGVWTDLLGATNIVVDNAGFTGGSISRVPLPAECSNVSSLFIRWIMTSNLPVSASNVTVQAGGSSRIDEIIVRGTTGGTHYRSVTSGNWSSTATWQQSSDFVSWTSASAAPSASTANTISILSGHTVTINSAVLADQVTINSGGTLDYSLSGASALTIYDGSGADLTVNGTFMDQNGTSVAWNSLTATWVLGSSGSMIRTNGSTSAGNWRDYYSCGMFYIPATANWILRKLGNGQPSLTTTGGTYYPNLTIEANSGSTWTTTTSLFTGSSDYPRIYGNLDVGGANVGTVNFANECSNATPIPVDGNITIRSNATLTIGNTGNNTYAGFSLKGNLIVDGSLTMSTPTGAGSRYFGFSGGNAQTISGSATSIAFYNLEINKTLNNVTLSKNITINSTLTLTAKNMVSAAATLPTLASGATVSGASNSSYVDGPIAASFSATPTITFPTGKGGYYRPIALVGVGGSGTSTFTGEYFNTGPNQASPVMSETSVGTGIHHVSAIEYWKLARTGTGSRTARINIGWAAPPYNAADLTLLNAMRLASWDGTAWQNVTGTISSGSITTSAAPTNYIAFTLASSTTDNPLPITLVEFIGKPMPIGNVLNWTSSSEKNNDHFSVERSQDMQHFEAIGEVKGNGSTEAISHYNFTDKQPLSGINYYRLRQFDFDGSNALSNIIALDAKSAVKTYTLANDAANQQLLLRLQASESIGEVTIIDLLGRKRMSQILAAGQEECGISCSQLEHGVYFLLIQHDGETQVQKFFY